MARGRLAALSRAVVLASSGAHGRYRQRDDVEGRWATAVDSGTLDATDRQLRPGRRLAARGYWHFGERRAALSRDHRPEAKVTLPRLGGAVAPCTEVSCAEARYAYLACLEIGKLMPAHCHCNVQHATVRAHDDTHAPLAHSSGGKLVSTGFRLGDRRSVTGTLRWKWTPFYRFQNVVGTGRSRSILRRPDGPRDPLSLVRAGRSSITALPRRRDLRMARLRTTTRMPQAFSLRSSRCSKADSSTGKDRLVSRHPSPRCS